MGDLRPGEVFVPGVTASTARTLLDAARKAGLPASVVRTTADGGGGFVVPEAIAPTEKKAARVLPVDPPNEPEVSEAAPTRPARKRRKNTNKEG